MAQSKTTAVEKVATLNMTRRGLLALGGAVLAATAMASTIDAKAAAAAVDSNGVGISGHDPVAYFTDNKATKGDSAISADHDGVTYHFASADNRDAFLASPARYAPQYGGFCAYAVSKGYTAPVDPEAFSVVDNKLYLNYSKGVRTRWSKDIPGNIQKGDANWPELSKK